MRVSLLLTALLLFLFLPQSAAGDVYRWVDKNGVKHFSNEPPPDDVAVFTKTEEIRTEEAKDSKPAEKEEPAEEEPEPDVEMDEAESAEDEEATPESMPEAEQTEKVVVSDDDDDTFHENRIRRRVNKDQRIDLNRESGEKPAEGTKEPAIQSPE